VFKVIRTKKENGMKRTKEPSANIILPIGGTLIDRYCLSLRSSKISQMVAAIFQNVEAVQINKSLKGEVTGKAATAGACLSCTPLPPKG